MTHKRLLSFAVLSTVAVLSAACFPGGDSTPEPSPTLAAVVESARTTTPATNTPRPSPTLPVLPTLVTYTVQSGDNPTTIAEFAGVPAALRDDWIAEMLALNGAEATSLQIGQKLILPPPGSSGAPTARSTPSTGSAPPAAPVDTSAGDEPEATSTPKPPTTFAGGVPFAATPPFVSYATATPTLTATATATPDATATATSVAPGERAWLTSSDPAAKYYYCDLDSGWTNVPADRLQAFDSEDDLLAVWEGKRTKAPDSIC